MSRVPYRPLLGVICALLLALLAACGGTGAGSAAPPNPNPSPPSPSPPSPSPSSTPTQVSASVTAFSWHDNNPPNSDSIGDPNLHQAAGGDGTFADPISAVASAEGSVPHAIGTIFYLPTLQRYVIVREIGAPPGPPGTAIRLIVWIDGRSGDLQATNACEDAITGTVAVFTDPRPNFPVLSGPIFANGACQLPR